VRSSDGYPRRFHRRRRAEAIALALEVGADAIVLDDRPARRGAEVAGLSLIGTLALLLKAKGVGHIPTVRPELVKLLASSRRREKCDREYQGSEPYSASLKR
jgi:predicted nucleic acid-binding protein